MKKEYLISDGALQPINHWFASTEWLRYKIELHNVFFTSEGKWEPTIIGLDFGRSSEDPSKVVEIQWVSIDASKIEVIKVHW